MEYSIKYFCQVCERNLIVKWKCKDCLDTFCDNCKKIHGNLSSTQSHSVTRLEYDEDERTSSSGKTDTFYCWAHDDVSELICITCNVPLCDRCEGGHIPPEHVINNIHEHWDQLLKKVDKAITSFEKTSSTLANIQSGEFEKDVIDKRNRCQYDIDLRRTNLIKAFEQKYNNSVTAVNNWFTSIMETLEKLKDRTDLMDASLQLKDLVSELNDVCKLPEPISKLSTVTKDLENRAKMLNKEIPQLHGVLFTRGELILNDIQREFGIICRETDFPRNKVKVAKLTVCDTIESNLHNISVLCPLPDCFIWEGSHEDKKLQMLSLQDVPSLINEIALTFYDCSISSMSDRETVYLSDHINKLIVSVSIDGTIKYLKDVYPLVPLCVHVTGNDEIVFGAVDQNSYEVDTRSIRLIVKMTMDGDMLHEYQFDDRMIRLFTIPIRCDVNPINDNILVVDSSGNSS